MCSARISIARTAIGEEHHQKLFTNRIWSRLDGPFSSAMAYFLAHPLDWLVWHLLCRRCVLAKSHYPLKDENLLMKGCLLTALDGTKVAGLVSHLLDGAEVAGLIAHLLDSAEISWLIAHCESDVVFWGNWGVSLTAL